MCSKIQKYDKQNFYHFVPDAGWGPYGDWTSCTVTCGGGNQVRQRECQVEPCTGSYMEVQRCNNQTCKLKYCLTLPN